MIGAVEGSAVLKFEPAAPMRTKRTMSWGMEAHLVEWMGLAKIQGR